MIISDSNKVPLHTAFNTCPFAKEISKRSAAYQALERLDPSPTAHKGFIRKALKWIEKTVDYIFKSNLEILQKKENKLIRKYDQINADYIILSKYPNINKTFNNSLIETVNKNKLRIKEKFQLVEQKIFEIQLTTPKNEDLEQKKSQVGEELEKSISLEKAILNDSTQLTALQKEYEELLEQLHDDTNYREKGIQNYTKTLDGKQLAEFILFCMVEKSETIKRLNFLETEILKFSRSLKSNLSLEEDMKYQDLPPCYQVNENIEIDEKGNITSKGGDAKLEFEQK
jgi:hypothetical protein